MKPRAVICPVTSKHGPQFWLGATVITGPSRCVAGLLPPSWDAAPFGEGYVPCGTLSAAVAIARVYA